MNTKEYTIKINGLEVSLKNVTKLEAALKALDAQAGKTSTTPSGPAASSTPAPPQSSGGGGTSTASTSRANTRALTDEEKAAARLAATQRRLAEADSEANRAQIEATQALRDRTREVSREIALNNLAEGSINAMGMQLTDLRNDYYDLSEAERENADVGGVMLEQIQALDAEYKALRESTGDFRDSVGNYEKALGGLSKLEGGLGKVDETVNGLSTAFAGNTQLMSVFGSITGATADAQAQLSKIIALVTVAQNLNSAATGENSVMKGINAAVTQVQTIQENARTIATNLSTRSTIAATVAQRVFNLVAAANPYVLLAIALVAVIGALIAFAASTDDSAESQKQLNDEQKTWLDYLDAEVNLLKQTSDARIAALERQLRLSAVNESNLKDTRKLENEIYREKLLQNARLLGTYRQEVEALEENRTKLMVYLEMIRDLRLAEARGDNSIALDIDLNGKAEKVDVKEAIDIVQGNVDNLNRAIEIGIKLKSDKLDLENEFKILEQERLKEDKAAAEKAAEDAKKAREEAKRRADELRKNNQEKAAAELEAQRALEDLKLKLAGESLAAQRKAIELSYERQVKDIQIRLKNETNLTKAARKALNDQIVALDKVMNDELDKLDKELNEKALETARLREDQEVALMKGATDRKLKEIDYLYDRQIDDVNRRLKTELGLTEQQRIDLNAMVEGYKQQQEKAYDDLTVEGLNRRAALELQTADNTLKQVQNRIGEVVARQEGGIFKGVIDPKKTRENLESINLAFDQYIESLREYQTNLAIAHQETLNGMKEGSDEYKEDVQKFAVANEDVSQRIREAQKSQKQNTKDYARTMSESYREMFEKIAGYADLGAQAVQAVVDTLNMGIQASLDALNDQLETTNDNYDNAKEKREKYAEDVAAIEEKVQGATGATADALRMQLQDAMHYRDEAAREEARLAMEKEKLQADIAKKEKQLKKNELIGKIAMGIANTAQGVTQMLSLAWPLNLIMAAIVGIAGGAQVAIMSRQLSKLAKGGPIVGPSHDNGGVNIMIDGKPSYEAQGGEFMVNDKSYASNKALIEFINSSPDTVNLADLVNIGMGFGDVPAVVGDVSGSNAEVVDAINGINIKPVVSVVDIQDVTNDVTTVKDLAGF